MAVAGKDGLCQGLVDGHEAMAGVDILGALDAVSAEVPVGTVQALVANAVDELLAPIADCGVANIAAGVAQDVSQSRELGIGSGGLEGMGRVVTVFVVDVAIDTKVKVVALGASDKLLLRQNLDTVVASSCRLFSLIDDWLLLLSERARHLLPSRISRRLSLGANTLGRAVDNASVFDEALHHPVTGPRAVDTSVDARWAEVVVTVVTDRAMEVLVFHWLVAVVAEDDPGALGRSLLGSEGEVCVWMSSQTGKELLAGEEWMGYWCFSIGIGFGWHQRRDWAERCLLHKLRRWAR